MALIDFYGIQSALADVLKSGPEAGYTTHPHNVFIEAMDREATFDNMPFLNVRLTEGTNEVRSMPNGYYMFLTFEVDVVCFDFTEFKKAANLRDDIMGEAMLALQQNARFHAGISTSTIAPNLRFGAGTPEGAAGHVAVGTFTVTVEADIDAS